MLRSKDPMPIIEDLKTISCFMAAIESNFCPNCSNTNCSSDMTAYASENMLRELGISRIWLPVLGSEVWTTLVDNMHLAGYQQAKGRATWQYHDSISIIQKVFYLAGTTIVVPAR
jgi:hypothetical protein